MVYKSLSFPGILAVLGITAHPSLQAELFPGLAKLPTPMLMEVLTSAGSAATASTVPAPWNAAPAQALGSQHTLSPPSSPVTGTCHMRKGPEQQPKLSCSWGGAGVAGKQMEPKVFANPQWSPWTLSNQPGSAGARPCFSSARRSSFDTKLIMSTMGLLLCSQD